MSQYQRKSPASGAAHHGKLRVVVAFDQDTFGQVRAFAVQEKVSFGEAVRQLVEFGLIDIADAPASPSKMVGAE